MKGIFLYIKKDLSSLLVLFLILAAGTAVFLSPGLFSERIEDAVQERMISRSIPDEGARSTLRFREADLETIRRIGGIGAAEGYFRLPGVLETNSLVRAAEIISLTTAIDKAELISGRLPAAWDECAVGPAYQSLNGVSLGQTILLAPREEDAIPLKTDTLKVVGIVRHPEFLNEEEQDFVVVSPELADLDPAEGSWTHILVQMSAPDKREFFSDGYAAGKAELARTMASFSARFTEERIRAMDDEYRREEAELMGGFDRRAQLLEADEAALAKEKSTQEAAIASLKEQTDAAQAALEEVQGNRKELKDSFDGISEQMEEARLRLEQLQSIDNIVRGELVQAEALLSAKSLSPVLPTFRQCAEGILSAFLKADLTRPSVMETAVENALNSWESAWDNFRSGLSPERVHEIELSTSRSLVSIGLQVSRQLRDYGSTLQSAGSQNPELQEEIRTVVSERGSGALSTAILQRINQTREEISGMETEYQQTALLLAAQDELLAEKQRAYDALKTQLDDAQLDILTRLNSEEARLIAARLTLDLDRQEGIKQLAERKAELDSRRTAAWTQETSASSAAVSDLVFTAQLAEKTALIGGIAAALAVLTLIFGLLSRQIRASLAEANDPAIRRKVRAEAVLKSGLAMLVPVSAASLAGVFLGRLLAGVFAKSALTRYSLALADAPAFGKELILPLAGVLLLWLLGLLLAFGAVSGRRTAWYYAPALFLLGALSCVSFGLTIWSAVGLIRRRSELAAALPSFFGIAPAAVLLLLACVMLLLVTVLPSLELFHADQWKTALALMRGSGVGTDTAAGFLRKHAYLPGLLGVACGAAAGIFLCGRLLNLLTAADPGFAALPLWLAFAPAAALALLAVLLIPAGTRRRAVREALSGESLSVRSPYADL